MSSNPYASPAPDPSKNMARSTAWLIRLHAVIAALTLVPCCFPINFAFLFGEIRIHTTPDFPEGARISPAQEIAVPFAVMFGTQVVLIGIPAAIASFVGRQRPLLAWRFGVGVAAGQLLLIVANLACLSITGPLALRELGLLNAMPLFAIQVALFFANTVLLWRAAHRPGDIPE